MEFDRLMFVEIAKVKHTKELKENENHKKKKKTSYLPRVIVLIL